MERTRSSNWSTTGWNKLISPSANVSRVGLSHKFSSVFSSNDVIVLSLSCSITVWPSIFYLIRSLSQSNSALFIGINKNTFCRTNFACEEIKMIFSFRRWWIFNRLLLTCIERVVTFDATDVVDSMQSNKSGCSTYVCVENGWYNFLLNFSGWSIVAKNIYRSFRGDELNMLEMFTPTVRQLRMRLRCN